MAPEGDLPFADPADIQEVETLFTAEDISSWASTSIAKTAQRTPEKPHTPPPIRKLNADKPQAPCVLEHRRRFRYYIARPFNGTTIATAPAARSGRRFTERTEIRYGENGRWERWPEVALTVVGLALAVWVLVSL